MPKIDIAAVPGRKGPCADRIEAAPSASNP
jgi:hypothetical protein